MKLAGIKPDDIVQADIRGQRFFARVEQVDERRVQIASLNGVKLGWQSLTARQVAGHYRRAAGSR